jgi:hypothetical protein
VDGNKVARGVVSPRSGSIRHFYSGRAKKTRHAEFDLNQPKAEAGKSSFFACFKSEIRAFRQRLVGAQKILQIKT